MKFNSSPWIIVFLIIALVSGCSMKNQAQKSGSDAIKFTYHAELYSLELQEFITIHDSILYYFSDGLVLCKLPVPFIEFYNKYDSKGNVFTDSIISITPKFKWLVYRQGENNAILFNKDSAIVGRNISVDSSIRLRTYYSSAMFNTPNDSLVEVKSGKNQITEKYIPKIKFDSTFGDSVYLNYTPEMQGIPFSLSKRLDSLHKWKLYKCQLIYNKIPASNSNPQIPRRELYFEIVPYYPEDKEYAAFLFIKFIEEEKK